MSRIWIIVGVACFMIASPPTDARADLIAYDGFDYTEGQLLNGQSGGTGFVSPWTGADAHRVIASSGLSYGDLPTQGNAVSRAATSTHDVGAARQLDAVFGTPNTTIYIAALMRPDGTVGAGAGSGYFGVGVYTGVGSNGVFFGKPGVSTSEWVISNGNGSSNTGTGSFATSGQTDLLVLRGVFSSTGDATLTLFVNPTPGDTEPVAGTTFFIPSFGTSEIIAIVGPGAYTIDELRIGETFADVADVPEPASAGLLGMAALVALGKRRMGLICTVSGF